MVYNEPDYTPMWARHYSRHVGPRNCYVVDHGSDDGSTDVLGEVNVIRIPRSPKDNEKRTRGISTLCGELLKSYDAVLHTDCDEFLVPDPRNYATLAKYAEAMPADVVTAIGLEIWQVPDQEPPIDLSRPITEQRRWTRFSSALCKPVLIRRPVEWSPGFHSSDAPTVFDTLYLFHLRYYDMERGLQRLSRTRTMPWAHDWAGKHQRMPDEQWRDVLLRLAALPKREGVVFDKALAPIGDWIARLRESQTGRENQLYKLALDLNADELWLLPPHFRGSF
jgi:hypothetical protein